jgi:hypothetical protein
MKVEESINFYDGLITEKKLNDINKVLLNKNFPWYYNHQTSENDYNFKNTFEHFQFAHWFIFNSEISSTYINDFKNVLDNVPINYDLIVRAKANFLPQVQNNSFNNPHKDIVRNDADGDTFIFNQEKEIIKRVTPKAGRVLIMSGDLIHTSSHPNKTKYRMILNINFLV